MTIYFIGDVQGCYRELRALLQQVNFSKRKDQLWLAGDLVARGPDSLSTLRYVKSLGKSAKVVLGNHDLHLLAIHAGIKKAKPSDQLSSLLSAPDVDELLNWLAKQPLIRKLPKEDVYMSHAGLPPEWTPKKALKRAKKASALLKSADRNKWLELMYGNESMQWSQTKSPLDKFRFTINGLTRMRYCYLDNSLDFTHKLFLDDAPDNIKPWFERSNNLKGCSWIFGHWAALMGNCPLENVYALDTGCVWGNHLTLLRWHDKKTFTQLALK